MGRKKKEPVYTDIFNSEDGYEIYFLGNHHEVEKWFKARRARKYTSAVQLPQADVCQDSGFFYDRDALVEFLVENYDEIEMVEDHAGVWDEVEQEVEEQREDEEDEDE